MVVGEKGGMIGGGVALHSPAPHVDQMYLVNREGSLGCDVAALAVIEPVINRGGLFVNAPTLTHKCPPEVSNLPPSSPHSKTVLQDGFSRLQPSPKTIPGVQKTRWTISLYTLLRKSGLHCLNPSMMPPMSPSLRTSSSKKWHRTHPLSHWTLFQSLYRSLIPSHHIPSLGTRTIAPDSSVRSSSTT